MDRTKRCLGGELIETGGQLAAGTVREGRIGMSLLYPLATG